MGSSLKLFEEEAVKCLKKGEEDSSTVCGALEVCIGCNGKTLSAVPSSETHYHLSDKKLEAVAG